MDNAQAKQDPFANIQKDVDDILDGIMHLFDHMAEYSTSEDPMNIIDIDTVLKRPVIAEPKPEPRARIVPTRREPDPASFPSAPKKVIVAAPRELQEEARRYRERRHAEAKRRKETRHINVFGVRYGG